MRITTVWLFLPLLAGCAAPANPPTAAAVPPVPLAIQPPAATALPRTRVAPAPAPPRTSLGLAWESYKTYDGEITGIESSTNLVTWTREAAWPLTVVSNTWRDTNLAAPAKFYRAFNE